MQDLFGNSKNLRQVSDGVKGKGQSPHQHDRPMRGGRSNTTQLGALVLRQPPELRAPVVVVQV